MFFQESEAIAREHSDLLRLVEQIDQQLSGIRSPAPLRLGDFSSALDADENQVVSVFDLLAHKGVLLAEEMVECEHCDNLMSAVEFRQSIEDEDPFECTGCSCVFPRYTEPLVVYRMTASALSRSKAETLLRNTKDSPTVPDTPPRPWPDPEKYTTAKVWSVKGGALRMSTKTNGQHDGMVEFAPTDSGELTYQMRFMQLLCFRFPTPISLADVIQQVYPDEFAPALASAAELVKTLRKVRTLVSDIRTKKLAKANLNPDILAALNIEATKDTGVVLRLAHLHRMDDKDLDDADEFALSDPSAQ